MRRDQLEHLIRAAGRLLEIDEVIVIGNVGHGLEQGRQLPDDPDIGLGI